MKDGEVSRSLAPTAAIMRSVSDIEQLGISPRRVLMVQEQKAAKRCGLTIAYKATDFEWQQRS